jgi:hypothetical protein
MKLKDYQERALTEVKNFLEQLAIWRLKTRVDGEWLGDFAEKAWEKLNVGRPYLKRKDGLERPLPVYCLSIPTGGGKTLLAVKTIDLVQSIYRQQQNGPGSVDCPHLADLPADIASLERPGRSLPATPRHGFGRQDFGLGKDGWFHAAGRGRALGGAVTHAAVGGACQQGSVADVPR